MDQSSVVSLNRLLGKLEQNLENSKPSEYDRNRLGVNLDNARSLLLTLEKQSSTIRVQSQRQQIQADLQTKREVVKRLNARLQDLEQMDEEDSDMDDNEEEESTMNRSYGPAIRNTDAGLHTGESEPQEPSQPQSQPQQQDLRARKPLSSTDNHTSATTTARTQLFASRPPTTTSTTQTTESLQTHNRQEQNALTSSLLALAQQLKNSATEMGASLESEKDVLKRAEGGLDKSSQGMEAAERKMGMLRRMSEGQGWLGRVKLYAMIVGLWVVCFGFVFLGPKLRF